MGEKNYERRLVKIVRTLCEEHGVEMTLLGDGWIIRLRRRGVVRHIHGYTFDLNPGATHAIACDKSACAEVLRSSGIAHVPHRLFLHPDMARFVDHRGNWGAMLEAFEEWGRDVVVKDNIGTGGRGVVRCRSVVSLEHAAMGLFARTQGVSLSPFVDALQEVRFVILDGRCEAAYAKRRPSVVGDGRRTVLEILACRVATEGMSPELDRYLGNLEPDGAGLLREVPGPGQEFLLNWRHNLGQGAAADLVDASGPGMRGALGVASQAADAIGLRFGSVDVLLTREGRPLVLEINSGVMMEALGVTAGLEHLAERVYARAFAAMFNPIPGITSAGASGPA